MGNFKKFSYNFGTSVMTFEGLLEMFESDSADKCTIKFPFPLMGVCTEGLACADPGARNPSV